jgi:hypothetical protein
MAGRHKEGAVLHSGCSLADCGMLTAVADFLIKRNARSISLADFLIEGRSAALLTF